MRFQRLLLTISAVASATLWAYACGDGTTEPPPYFPEPATVTVSPATAELTALGATVQLSAEVRDQNGQVMAGATVTWATSAAAVATVSASGLVTAVANGTSTITATAGDASGSATVTVAQEVSTVAVTPDTATVLEGDTLRLAATATDANGQVVTGAEFTWASGDTAVAVVDASGLVTGVAAGQVQVTATAAGLTGRAELAVVTPLPTTVAVTPDTVVLTAVGQTAQLTAEVRDQAGRVMEGVPVAWLSAETTVAAVDASGLVTAVGGGAVTITATAGEASGDALVTVEIDLDRAALVALYEATGGPGWVNNQNWLTDTPLREWHGVRVDGRGRVTTLALERNGLVGEIPPTIASLANLTTLRLSSNDVTGLIPPELGGLAHLTTLALGWNGLTGPIPSELGALANLEVLGLTVNGLTGPIPPDLGGLANLRILELRNNGLTGPIPSELGNLAHLTTLAVSWNRNLVSSQKGLTGAIPPELGNLANLRTLSLEGNSLTGPIPPELGNLANLTRLALRYNHLTDPIPPEFLGLGLTQFTFMENESLCAPGTAVFVAWLQRTPGFNRGPENGPFCNESDVAVLESLYEAAGGAHWANSAGWLQTPLLDEWYGVSADSIGRVKGLDLSGNGLVGRLTQSLGQLTGMTALRIGSNALSGRLPQSLVDLALRELSYTNTDLCVPAEDVFLEWLNSVLSHEGTGVECDPVSDRDFLVALYDATGGPNWTNADNWLTDAPLGEWHGVRVDDEGRVTTLRLDGLVGQIPPTIANLANLTSLSLGGSDLAGPIPPELGDLANLQQLGLVDNGLTGPIPPELGKLTRLVHLNLYSNELTGPIPPELGKLAQLGYLNLADNQLTGQIPAELANLTRLRALWTAFNPDLTGPIPPELGNLADLSQLILNASALTGPIPPELGRLADLRTLRLHDNELTGPIPPELGGLANLRELSLSRNRLMGPIPPELGNLRQLTTLFLNGNDLTGLIPPTLGRLARLRELLVAGNVQMSGVLPTALTSLNLETLFASGTSLCAPPDPIFLEWLQGIREQRVAICGAESMAYLTQAVQSREFPVPLVAGEEALLRVFVTAVRAGGEQIPPVSASLYLNGTLAHTVDIPEKPGPVPTEITEGYLARSANVLIPAEVLRPGLEMVIEIDPDGTLDPALGVGKRIPETGRMAVDIATMPLFDLTVVPFLWVTSPDSSIMDITRGMAADPENDRRLWHTRTLLPIADLDVRAHEPVLSSSNSVFDLLRQTQAIRAMEGADGYYMGTISGSFTGASGVAVGSGRVSVSVPTGSTIAHELGHNMSLGHCRENPLYPHEQGSIGAYGFDFRAPGRVVWPRARDIMCGADWISDYHFAKAFRHRLFDDGATDAVAAAAPRGSLLLWGGVDVERKPFLEPAFVIDAPAALPDFAGDYRITGRTAGGGHLFAVSFTMPATADGNGSSSFAFALPVRAGWEGSLATITLSGPGGSVTLDGESDIPMAILRNPRTGQVRGILRDPPLAAEVAADAVGVGATGLEVLFSRGIPGAAGWRR